MYQKTTKEFEKYHYGGLFYFILCFLIVNTVAVIYVLKSNFLYYWDNATYWDISNSLAGQPFHLDFFKNMYASIGDLDYNYFAGFLSAVFAKQFGNSRLVYILSIVNCYTIPSFMMIYSLSKKICRHYMIGAVTVTLLCPVILFIGLVGFVDVGGLLLALICYRLYWKGDGEQEKLYKAVIIGILLTVMMLFRRYFAFFALSFVTAMIGECIISNRRKLPVAVVLFEIALFLVVLFPDFLFHKLLNNYGELYASYKFSLSTDLKLFTRYFGLISIAAVIGGSIAVTVIQSVKTTYFPWIQMGACFLMFVGTQTHGQQHLLMYVPALVVLAFIILENADKRIALAGMGVLAAVNTANTCIVRTQPESIRQIRHYALIPDFSMLPRQREDAPEILAVKQFMDEAVPAESAVTVLASSFVINDDILRKCELSLNQIPKRQDYLKPAPYVDSRDTDLEPLFQASYMLVAFPAQTHLGEENQQVVVQAVKSFEDGTDFSKAFEAVSDDMKVGEITLRLYKRKRTVSDYEKYEFKNRLEAVKQ